jgi:hypothetical protein
MVLWVDYLPATLSEVVYRCSANCDGTTFDYQCYNEFAGGNYTWWIQTWNVGGRSWSDAMSFNITPPGKQL